MQNIFTLAIVGITLLLCDSALSQEPSEVEPRFAEADTDSDGTLTIMEFKAYVAAKLPDFHQFDLLMEQLDENEDDTISPAEFAKRRSVTQKLINKAPVEFADEFNIRYAKQKPQVGDTLGELIAFDENGDELDFESLKGKYTVFNFGCLT